jgi:hypothetical protein
MRHFLKMNGGTLVGIGIGMATVLTLGSGVAVAANTNLVHIVNHLLAVSVKNTAADPVPASIVGEVAVNVSGTPSVRVTNLPQAERTPFQSYVNVPPGGVLLATVPAGKRLVISYVNSRHTEGDFLALLISGPTMARYDWVYRNGAVDSNPLIYAEAGSELRLFEGSSLTVNPDVAVSGYYEPAP